MFVEASLALILIMALTLWRAFKGPTVYDRILAVNSFGTLTGLLIVVRTRRRHVNPTRDFVRSRRTVADQRCPKPGQFKRSVCRGSLVGQTQLLCPLQVPPGEADAVQ